LFMFHRLALPVLFLFSCASYAQEPRVESLLHSLSKCDDSFFRLVASSKVQLVDYAPLARQAGPTGFAVPDRAHETESRVLFRKPIRAAGHDIVGYFDEVHELLPDSHVYSWGFLVAGSVETVATAFQPFIWDAQRLRAAGPVFVRAELWTHANPDAGWTNVRAESGIPGRGTVERVLLVEPYDGETRFIRFGCSLQGSVTPPLIREMRPDLR
ncbi:MAG: hypothetical protein ABW051_02950, partial [Burkholderiaceae bacterium]